MEPVKASPPMTVTPTATIATPTMTETTAASAIRNAMPPSGMATLCGGRARVGVRERRCAVAHSANRRHEPRPIRLVTQLVAEAAYVRVDRAVQRFGLAEAVQRIEELVAAEHAAVGAGEHGEEAEFGRGEGDGLARDRYLVTVEVHQQVAVTQHLGGSGRGTGCPGRRIIGRAFRTRLTRRNSSAGENGFGT